MTVDRAAVLEVVKAGPGDGLQAAEVAQALGASREQRSQVRAVLKEMAEGGVLVQQGRRFTVNAAAPPAAMARGVLKVRPRGTATVEDEVSGEVVLLAEQGGAGAVDGDRVALETWSSRGRVHGRIVQILSRGRTRITGLYSSAPYHFTADDPRLTMPIEVVNRQRISGEQVVLAAICDYPERAGDPLRVAIERVLGEAGDSLVEIERLLVEGGVEESFPAAVLAEAQAVPDHVRPSDHIDRVDLRDRTFLTIDPETARDFDDAVAIEPGPHGLSHVWVAVADVSHYVGEGSAIDEEARRRGCSVYLPDRAIPMLPESLSSHICSLVPKQDRLALAVRLDIDAHGHVVSAECFAALIHSRERLDYAGVAAALQGDFRGKRAAYRQHLESLQSLMDVAQKLRTRRMQRGSLDLALPETKVVLDEDDPACVRAIVSTRADEGVRQAYNLIEELMLAANEAVARLFEANEEATLWRVHGVPLTDALVQLAKVLGSYGVPAEADALREPRGMARLLETLRAHPAGQPLSYLVLRSLKQATYEAANSGHFGLASEAYLHFTSPIRRYPDLHVHRLVKHLLRAQGHPSGGREVRVRDRERETLARMGAAASSMERRAQEIERNVRSLYAAKLMRERIGDEFDGRVTGMAPFGVFVTLAEPAVDGMIAIERLPRAAEFDVERYRMVAAHSRWTIALGDAVRVRVTRADVRRRRIDFELLEEAGFQHSASPAPRGKPSRVPRRTRQTSFRRR